MTQAFKALAKFDEYAETRESCDLASNHVAGTMCRDESFPRAGREVFHRKRKTLSGCVDVRHDRVNFLILLQKLLRMLEFLGPGYVRDVDKPVDAFFKLDKCTKIGEIANLAVYLGPDRIFSFDCCPKDFPEAASFRG